jgi:hypothetical protein
LVELAGKNADLARFLDQAVIQAARAVEINHVRFCDIGRVAGLEWIVKLQREPAGDGPLLSKGVLYGSRYTASKASRSK